MEGAAVCQCEIYVRASYGTYICNDNDRKCLERGLRHLPSRCSGFCKIFKEGELEKDSVHSILEYTATDGGTVRIEQSQYKRAHLQHLSAGRTAARGNCSEFPNSLQRGQSYGDSRHRLLMRNVLNSERAVS